MGTADTLACFHITQVANYIIKLNSRDVLGNVILLGVYCFAFSLSH